MYNQQEMPDIDSCDTENPLAVTEYVNDIFSYWFRVEPETQVAPNYMLIQTDINDKMRAILDRLAGGGAPEVQADAGDVVFNSQPD